MIVKAGRRARFFLLWILIGGAIAAVGWLIERPGTEINGQARVVDGDSLTIGQTEIRLYGIDAVELYQTCDRGGRPWNCGAEAAQSLRNATAGREVRCVARERDRFNRVVALCRAGGLDLAAAMVRGGYAVAFGAYEADEREARDARRGIWASNFDKPAVWRARHPRRERPP